MTKRILGSVTARTGSLLGGLLLCLIIATPVTASTGSLLILHTNDVHDHLRPGYVGIGGLPYVSGFVQQVRAVRDDVLLLDAGDVLEKGDLLAYRTHGAVTFEAMGRIDYDAVTIGNHDLDFGIAHLQELQSHLEQPLLLLNLLDRYGEPYFAPSRIVEVNGVKVGIIGMLAPRNAFLGGLDHEASGRALAAEAERLAGQVHVVLALCHQGSEPVLEWARMAPAVDVFVAGHHHETLLEPLVSEATGAIVVSAGSDAHWVGHLELEVDLESKEVLSHTGGLNLMRHDRVPVDADMLAWLEAYEAEVAPEASEFIIDNDRPLSWFAVARLAADTIRRRAGADVALYHPTQIVRNGLPAGQVDYNALFRLSAERVDPLLRLRMTGAEISQYMTALARSDWGQTQWSGFRVSVRETDDGRALYDNDLEPEQYYDVVVPEREWQRYMLEIFEYAYIRTRDLGTTESAGTLRRRNLPGEVQDFRMAEALRDVLRDLAAEGVRVSDYLQGLRDAQGDADPNEARYAARFLAPLNREHFLELERQTQGLELRP